MDLAAPERGLLAIGVEVYTLLWPMAVPGDAGRSPTISLPGGLSVSMGSVQRVGWRGSIEYLVSLPQPFWQWWSAQPNGVEALRRHCHVNRAQKVVDQQTYRYKAVLPTVPAGRCLVCSPPVTPQPPSESPRARFAGVFSSPAGRLLPPGDVAGVGSAARSC